MKNWIAPTLAVAFLAGCATNGTTSSEGDKMAANPGDPNVRCERYKPVGSNMTERRCYVIGSEEDETRRTQDAMRRMSPRTGSRVGDGP